MSVAGHDFCCYCASCVERRMRHARVGGTAVDQGHVVIPIAGDPPPREKDRWGLLPWRPVRAIVRMIAYGLEKHHGRDFRSVSVDDHFEALMRHLTAWRDGELLDEEGMPHLTCAATRALFLLDLAGGE